MSKLSFKIIPGKKPAHQELVIYNSKNMIEAKGLLILHMTDHGHQIAYMPALDMSGYGETQGEAMEMLAESVHDYFEQVIKLRPEEQSIELAKYGWSQDKHRKKHFLSDVTVDKAGVLKNFELPEDTPVNELRIAV